MQPLHGVDITVNVGFISSLFMAVYMQPRNKYQFDPNLYLFHISFCDHDLSNVNLFIALSDLCCTISAGKILMSMTSCIASCSLYFHTYPGCEHNFIL